MAQITVVGSINLDLVANTPRLPRPGETIGASGFRRHPGGKGANQALAARRAGSDVYLVGAVGDDGLGEEALTLIRAAEVDTTAVEVVEGPTGIAMITVADNGENQIVVVPGANESVTVHAPTVRSADLVLCQLEVPVPVVEEAAGETRGLFCLNAAPASSVPTELLERADVVVVNETERDLLAEELRAVSGLVVVTLGPAGAKAYRSARLVAEARPPSVRSVDTVGAGDAFVGGLVTKLAEGTSISHALRWGCAAGAIAVTRRGAQPSMPESSEVDSMVGV